MDVGVSSSRQDLLRQRQGQRAWIDGAATAGDEHSRERRTSRIGDRSEQLALGHNSPSPNNTPKIKYGLCCGLRYIKVIQAMDVVGP